ncbi:RHS repeat-associated core domain-containing protein [Streptomyces sp. NPDC096198]|uniref:RHS repeat-associated core domain-containing protein n=1 Tax=Streptomyces sp. NPDC096198 TaxID=3366080 RepID=UPI00380BDCEF
MATHSSDGHYTYLIPDREGTGSLAIDSGTQAVTRRQYKPFGEQRDQTGTWTAGQRGYVGGVQDDNTGLTNLGAREYDPAIGRFLSPDPLLDSGAPQSWNAYDYADDSPVTTSDPSGACAAADCPTRNCPYCLNATPGDPGSIARAMHDHPGSGSTPNNTKSYAKHYAQQNKADISESAHPEQAWHQAVERAKATADATLFAAKKEASGLKHQILSLVADVIGLTDAYNCFTKGDVMGCINTALTAVPWGKVFKAIKVGIEAFKVWRALDRAYTAVKDAEEAAKIADDALDAERAFREASDAESAGADAAGCATHSFVPTTAVRLADGASKPISQVKAGDTVLATDPQTGVTAPEKVQRVIVTTTDRDFTTLTLDTAPVRGPPHHTTTQQQTLTTTWHHPFWDATHHRWTDAHNLTPGTKLRQPDGTTITVRTVHNFHQHRTTYDLTVNHLHTYYVLAGATPVLVHNCNRAGLDFTDAERQKVYDANAAKNGGEYKCDYCGQTVERRASRDADGNAIKGRPDDAQIDHIEPRASGGHGGDHNGAVACRRCNRDKSTKPLEDWDDELREFLDD